MTLNVSIELVGALKQLAGTGMVSFEFENPVTVEDVILKLVRSFKPELTQAVVDPSLNDPRPNVLILLNKIEVSVLSGLSTRVRDGDRLVLIPVSHGG